MECLELKPVLYRVNRGKVPQTHILWKMTLSSTSQAARMLHGNSSSRSILLFSFTWKNCALRIKIKARGDSKSAKNTVLNKAGY